MMNLLDCPVVKVDNATLNRYFDDHVPVEKEKTKRIREEVLSDLDAILDYVNCQDKHYGKAVRVGSSIQGLNVNVKGDVDYSVIFIRNPKKDEDHPSNTQKWNYSSSNPRYYGFKKSTKSDISSLSEHLKVVATEDILPSPEPWYLWIGGMFNSDLKEFVCNGDLIPFLVKQKFKRLLLEASKQLRGNGDMKLSKITHGPALTYEAEVNTSDDETHPVSIDLAVVIRARLPFLAEMRWPVTGKLWPPKDKIQSILKKGINVVAKKPFYWQLSFAELETDLVVEIDEDGGCRKKVHRIMKAVFYTVCKKDAALSSYMLKNVWFLEIEKYPNTDSWQPEHLAERYNNCLESLRQYVQQGKLPQYFNRSVDLLKDKNVREDIIKIIGFDFEEAVNKKREAEDVPVLQTPGKIPRV